MKDKGNRDGGRVGNKKAKCWSKKGRINKDNRLKKIKELKELKKL